MDTDFMDTEKGSDVTRKMTEEDLPSVKALMQSIPGFWHEAWTDETLQDAFSRAEDLALVAESDGQVVGCVFCYDCGFRAYLAELAVVEREQRRGIGQRLLREVESILRERKCELIISDVLRSAEPFYRKLGWKEPYAVLLSKRFV